MLHSEQLSREGRGMADECQERCGPGQLAGRWCYRQQQQQWREKTYRVDKMKNRGSLPCVARFCFCLAKVALLFFCPFYFRAPRQSCTALARPSSFSWPPVLPMIGHLLEAMPCKVRTGQNKKREREKGRHKMFFAYEMTKLVILPNHFLLFFELMNGLVHSLSLIPSCPSELVVE